MRHLPSVPTVRSGVVSSSERSAATWSPARLAAGCTSIVLPGLLLATSCRGFEFGVEPSVPSPVQVTVERTSYEVTGTTTTALRASLDRSRPADPEGERFDAVTTWFVTWDFNYSPRPGGPCEMDSVKTKVDVHVVLPRWTDQRQADAALRERWKRYESALLRHEQGHETIAIRAARAIQTTLIALEAPKCRDLHHQANAVGEQILERYRTEERRYDQTTDHGRSRGARFGD